MLFTYKSNEKTWKNMTIQSGMYAKHVPNLFLRVELVFKGIC